LLLAILAVALLWPLYHFFQIGGRLYDLAIGAVLVFSTTIILALMVAGLVWGAIKLFGLRE
jgi:hypothetical protein